MSEADIEDVSVDEDFSSKSKKKFIIIGLVILLAIGGVFLEKDKIFSSSGHTDKAASSSGKKAVKLNTVMLDIPPLVSNLDSGDGRSIYVKLTAKVEVVAPDMGSLQDKIVVIQDVLQTYLHETRRQDIRGDGVYRLREAILRRLRVELAPLQVENLYFVDFLIQ